MSGVVICFNVRFNYLIISSYNLIMTYANIMENVQEGDLIFCTELSRLGDDI